MVAVVGDKQCIPHPSLSVLVSSSLLVCFEVLSSLKREGTRKSASGAREHPLWVRRLIS